MFSTVILAHFDGNYNVLQLIRKTGVWKLIAFHSLEVSAQLQTTSLNDFWSELLSFVNSVFKVKN